MPRKARGTLPSGSVRYQLYIGADPQGKRIYKSFTASTKAEAKRMAQLWQEEHQKQPQNASNPTFSEAAEDFLVRRSKVLSPSTQREYKRTLVRLEENFPAFCRSRMSVICSETVQDIVNRLSAKSLSPKTVSNYYGYIVTVLTSQDIELRGIKLPQRQKPALNIPEDKTVSALLEAIKGTALEIPVLLAAWGPMRRGEICALKIDDIDFTTNTVHVCRNMVLDPSGSWVIKLPKTTAGDRSITYPSYVIGLIQAQGYVTKANPNTLSRHFKRCLVSHDLSVFRFHDLRHFAASFQIALGIPPEYVMERGGWHSPGTMQRYVHALDQQRQEMAKKANDAFSALL